jgi:drug/metabolite transporter (DMT)-like permease
MSSTIAPIEERRNYGIGILLFAQIFFTILDTSAKWLSVSGIPLAEIMFVRYGVHVVLMLVLFLPAEGRGLFRSRNLKLEVLRALCLLGVTLGNFLAMRFLPLTVTGALMFTMPLLVCALSVPLLKERVGWRRWAAISVGFIGILIIVRPGTEAFHPASLICLCGALCAALYSILTRKLAGVDSPQTQQTYAGVIALTCITPFAFQDWVWPSDAPTWFAFFAAGAAGTLAHQLNTIAHRYAPPSTLAPFSYTELILLAFASWLIFNEPPDMWFYLGAPLILGSGIYIWMRERQLSKAPALAPMED